MANTHSIASKEYDPKGLDPYNYEYENSSNSGAIATAIAKVRKLIAEFLWFSAGADKQILKKCPHSERVKYLGLGGVVLATAILAFFSGSYAFFTVFGPKIGEVFSAAQQELGFSNFGYSLAVIKSILAGLAWAAVIFNLDRFIVTSTGHGDGTEAITNEELKNGLPRILLAIVVALCLAAPLEIRIFKTELDAEITSLQQEKLSEFNKEDEATYEKNREYYGQKKIEAESALSKNDERRQALIAEIRKLETEIDQEVSGQAPNRIPGKGPGYQTKLDHLAALKAERDILESSSAPKNAILEQEIKDYVQKIDQAKQKRDENYKLAQKKAVNVDGLALRIKLSHEKFPTESIFLTLMLVFIEITPVFIKMQFIRGPYDYLSENQNQMILAAYGIQEKYQTVTDERGNPKQILVPIFHVADSISDYEVGKLNVERNLAKIAHKVFQEKVAEDIRANPQKYMPDIKKIKI